MQHSFQQRSVRFREDAQQQLHVAVVIGGRTRKSVVSSRCCGCAEVYVWPAVSLLCCAACCSGKVDMMFTAKGFGKEDGEHEQLGFRAAVRGWGVGIVQGCTSAADALFSFVQLCLCNSSSSTNCSLCGRSSISSSTSNSSNKGGRKGSHPEAKARGWAQTVSLGARRGAGCSLSAQRPISVRTLQRTATHVDCPALSCCGWSTHSHPLLTAAAAAAVPPTVEVDDSAFLDLMDGGEMMMESDDE